MMKLKFIMHTLLWLAIVLAVLWLILKFAVAVTGAALHLLWIAAVIMLVVWALGLLRGRPAPRP